MCIIELIKQKKDEASYKLHVCTRTLGACVSAFVRVRAVFSITMAAYMYKNKFKRNNLPDFHFQTHIYTTLCKTISEK